MRVRFLGKRFTFSYIKEKPVIPKPFKKKLGRPAEVPSTINDPESVLRNLEEVTNKKEN